MGATKKEIVKQVIEDNQKGFERLAREEPAAERRSRLKRLERKIKDFLQNEKEVGHIRA